MTENNGLDVDKESYPGLLSPSYSHQTEKNKDGA
jgi:hypothetical protein